MSQRHFSVIRVSESLPDHRRSSDGSKFRADLNWATQISQAARDKEQRRRLVAMADWECTRASEEDHRFMVCALVIEAARYRKSSAVPMSQRQVHDILHDIKNRFAQLQANTDVGDTYVASLNCVSTLTLFFKYG